ncbi:response regulator [Thermodesulfobacteriota bacterium]
MKLPLTSEPVENIVAPITDFPWRLRILVIDDKRPIVDMFKRGLEKYRQTVFTALSGEIGLQVFEANEVDLVICDLSMPGMSGWEVGRAIRDSCREPGVEKPRFISITGWGDQAVKTEKMEESGVDAVVEKPVLIPKLLGLIDELMKPRHDEGR